VQEILNLGGTTDLIDEFALSKCLVRAFFVGKGQLETDKPVLYVEIEP
jgi:hypothetical protein